MSAFYFGSSERPLFGFYHQPESRPVRPDGVVLCNPVGKEYLRTHRTLKQLAMRLAELGHHVLRFDYFGTGDSGGEGAEATLEQWQRDVATAVDELRAMAGVRRVNLVGVRMGAAVAATAATGRGDLEDVVLWDPVVTGSEYLGELLDHGNGSGEGLDEDEPVAPLEVAGAGGFPVGPELRQEIRTVDLKKLSSLPARRTLLVVSEERGEHRALREHLSGLSSEVRWEHRPGAEGWENPGRMGNIVLVPAIVGTITDFLEERP